MTGGPGGARGRLRAALAWAKATLVYQFLAYVGWLFANRRVFGLSAEAAFWATFTLPWLVLGAVAATSGLSELMGRDITGDLRQWVSETVSQVLTPQAVNDLVLPLLDSVSQGSAGLTILGLAAALWSGSRIFGTFVEGSLVIRGHPPRGYIRTRGMALGTYVLVLVVLALILVTIIRSPEIWFTIAGIAPGPNQFWWVLGFALVTVIPTSTVMYIANPDRGTWTAELAGGCLAVAIWVVGSSLLQNYLEWLLSGASIYRALAAPIAIMLWIFVSTLAMFIGITVNTAVQSMRGWGHALTELGHQAAAEPTESAQ